MTRYNEFRYISNVLSLHFKFVGRPVGCSEAKSFLPIFADPDFNVSIPTPITVHLENCAECQNDLKVLSELDLRKDQLFVLAQILAIINDESQEHCTCDISSLVGSMEFGTLTKQQRRHACTCKHCITRAYKVRGAILKGLDEVDECRMLYEFRNSEMFEICMPFSRVPQNLDGDAGDTIRHIRSCFKCLSRVQELSTKINVIALRSDSGVKTIYNLSNEKIDLSPNYDKNHSDWPISVQVLSEKK